MKNPFILFSLTLFLYLPTKGFAEIVYEQQPWDVVLEMAQSQNRPIFVKTYADYCAPCKNMDKNVFTDPEVIDFYNSNFINYKVDMQSNLGGIFNLAYEVSTIPDLLYFHPNGEIIVRSVGGQSVTDVLDLGKSALDKIDVTPNSTYANYPKKSETPKASREKVKSKPIIASSQKKTKQRYYKKDATPSKNQTYYDTAESINRFLKTQRNRFSNVYTVQNMDYIYHNATNLQSDAMDLLLRRKQDFVDRYGWENIDNLIRQSVLDAAFEAVVYRDVQLFEKCVNTLRKSDLPDKQEQMFQARIMFYEGIGDWDNYSRTIDWYLNRTQDFGRAEINIAAWKMYENTSNASLLSRASRWLEKSIELDDRFYNNNVYAHILHKMGRHKKARKVAVYAINLAKGEGRDYTDLEILLNRLHSFK